MVENDDIIVKGGGQIVITVIIIDENDETSGCPKENLQLFNLDPHNAWPFKFRHHFNEYTLQYIFGHFLKKMPSIIYR